MPIYQIISERKANYEVRISSPNDALQVLDRYRKAKQEHFICLSLNGNHVVEAVRIVSIGLVNRTVVHPREVFADPIVDRAAAVLLAHNHPSGNIEPSSEDREVTRRMKEAGNILGIPVLDHIILGKGDSYFSFLESGELN
ncbi:MAG: JAB domain-containing protein [Spirochaetales bacterium]|nr:JAB domain-containing protein [Spirochaetales bacterium]